MMNPTSLLLRISNYRIFTNRHCRKGCRILIATVFAWLVAACDQPGNTQSENKHRWQIIVDTDPLDGSKDIQMLMGTVNRLPSQHDPVILVLTCMRGTTSAYVVWRRYLGVYDPEVTWRVGSDPSVTETWVLSTDNEATFVPEPVELIKNITTVPLNYQTNSIGCTYRPHRLCNRDS